MADICRAREYWVYIKYLQREKYGRMTYEVLFDHYLGHTHVGNMASAVETKLTSTSYNSE
jgi:hypothetical protein